MTYQVAVRALCEFTAKQGDLDLRFTPSPTAGEGIAGHAAVAARRRAGYEKEIRLSGAYQDLQVDGRADGYDPDSNTLEEIKTHRGDLARQPENHRALHWAQACIYGWLLCQARDLDEIDVCLLYYDVDTQTETPFVRHYAAAELALIFKVHCERFLAWARREAEHRARRDGWLQALRFPQPEFRAGQRQLAEAVYRASRDGKCLVAQAPTGIGKTLGTLFPQLKAFPGQKLDKLFFLTAKTSGRRVALDALASLDAGADRSLRVLELVARDKACEHPDRACHGDSCPLAKGFYDRLPAARSEAASQGVNDQQRLRGIALAHDICPYYLSQEMARWADVVVGDYNYYFDQSALLFALAQAADWRVCVLVDEAHNLLERARGMYSAELDQGRFLAARAGAPAHAKKALQRISRCWNALNRERDGTYEVLEAAPESLLGALQQFVADVGEQLAVDPSDYDADLQRFYFDAIQFCRMAEVFGDHSLFDCTLQADRVRRGIASPHQRTAGRLSRLCLRNVVPAPFLKPRFEQAHATVLFSATIGPQAFFSDLIGVPPDSAWLDVESPFSADQLTVRVARHVSTRYADREASLPHIVDIMARQFDAVPGNYLAFFSSFAYLQQAFDAFAARCPDVDAWHQTPGMSEAERHAFLERFAPAGRGMGFAVLGGAFGEGVDLPGDRLIGAFIATLGIPQVNPVNEEFRQRLGGLFGRGYDYTYLYPGMQKVVQAAGRVIRARSDRGVIHLMDDRFAQARVRELLPAWWPAH
jgi:DNA excision repair protein ERCC-2